MTWLAQGCTAGVWPTAGIQTWDGWGVSPSHGHRASLGGVQHHLPYLPSWRWWSEAEATACRGQSRTGSCSNCLELIISNPQCCKQTSKMRTHWTLPAAESPRKLTAHLKQAQRASENHLEWGGRELGQLGGLNSLATLFLPPKPIMRTNWIFKTVNQGGIMHTKLLRFLFN